MSTSGGSGSPSVIPFDGTVNVSFSSAVVASSERALVVRDVAGRETYYLPLEDVYMTFFQESERLDQQGSPIGPTRYWSVGAVGEQAADAMWAHDPLEQGYEALRDHVGFDPSKLSIDATPRPDPEHRIEWP